MDTALIGAPKTKRNTEPDARSLGSLSVYPVDDSLIERPLSNLLSQTETLLQAHQDTPNQPMRIRFIALNYAHLSSNVHRSSPNSDERARMSALSTKIARGINPDQSVIWQRSLLAAMSSLLAPSEQAGGETPFTGELTIRGGASSGTLELHRTYVEDGWVAQKPMALDLSGMNSTSKRTLSSTVSLSEGWYHARYTDGDHEATWQQYISSETSSAVNIPTRLDSKGLYRFVHAGYALLGDATNTQQQLAFDVYAVPSFYLAPKRVSFGDYFMFLRFISRTQGTQSAHRRVPRTAPRGGYRWHDLDLQDEALCRDTLGDLYDKPVTGVSFHDARAYCHWLNIETGPGHRMPSEIEWAKAVRGCLGTKWAWGDHWNAEGCRSPSPFGIMDGTADLLEWTSSTAEDTRYRIARGVTLLNGKPSQAGPERRFLPEEQVSANVTFRVARSID